MFCGKCGKELPNTAKFCPVCGTKTINGQQPVQPAQPVQPKVQPVQPKVQPVQQQKPVAPQAQPQYTVKQPVKKPQQPPKNGNGGNKGVLIGIIIALAVIVLGLVGFIVYQNVVNDNSNKNAQQSSAVQSSTAKPSSTVQPSTTVPSSVEPSSSVAPEDRDYIIPDSSSRIIDLSEIENLTAEELRLARNEIYARHGRKFQDVELQNYFNSKTWYRGTIEPKDFTDNMLSDIEKANKDKIVEMETRKR